MLLKHQEAAAAKAKGERYRPENLIGQGDIVVCDEAGMLDTYAMHALIVACHQSGARLICVGDRNQHGRGRNCSAFRAHARGCWRSLRKNRDDRPSDPPVQTYRPSALRRQDRLSYRQYASRRSDQGLRRWCERG
ncbi:hypothetical protein EFK68_05030 [Pseudomonas aeruginosa]|nr:hypothetical protein EFK68_05030 [Pseudomonas aeruginosa]